MFPVVGDPVGDGHNRLYRLAKRTAFDVREPFQISFKTQTICGKSKFSLRISVPLLRVQLRLEELEQVVADDSVRECVPPLAGSTLGSPVRSWETSFSICFMRGNFFFSFWVCISGNCRLASLKSRVFFSNPSPGVNF